LVRPEKIEGAFANLRTYVEKLRLLAAIPRQEFLSDFRNVESAKHLLQVSIACCLDVAHHIIASEQFRAPRSYAESFDILVEQKVLPASFLPTLRRMVQFRNRLVHMYWDVDAVTIYDEILQKNLGDFDAFVRYVVANLNL